MNIILKPIDIDFLLSKFTNNSGDFPFIVQYADFNVLNYFFENKLNVNNIFFLYPDSSAVYFYLKFFRKKKIQQIVSTDFQNFLLMELNKNHKNIFLFGDSNNILIKTRNKINGVYANLSVVGYHNGYNYNNETVVKSINSCNVDILFVGLGVGRQEKWILENYNKLNVKIIISVGGWFQYLSGNKKRAPLFFRKNHLEWLHKLFNEFPRVAKRYFIGVPKFLYRVFTKKIIIRCK